MTLILVALLLTTIFVVAALVIDLGFVRQNRQADKSAADFAAAAGIRGMDDGSGQIDTWGGICTAVDYLKVNRTEFAALTAVSASDDPITPDPCSSPPTEYCVSSPGDWRSYVALAGDGNLRITIQNGYDLSASGFAEDIDEYAGDEGDDPCEHLAVIVEQRQDPFFGGVAGSSGWETTMRSVARLSVGDDGDVSAALVLLERFNCNVVDVSGVNAGVDVAGVGINPGIIHSDSLGNGSCTSGQLFRVNGSVPPPRITARRAVSADPVTSVVAPGEVSSFSKFDPAGVASTTDNTPVNRVCAQVNPTDCAMAGAGSQAVARDLVGRGRVDARYRSTIAALHSDAVTRFGWTAAQATANGFTVEGCNAAGPFTAERVWIGNCGGGGYGTFTGNNVTFADTVKEVVISASVTLSGSNNTLDFRAPDRVFIKGDVTLGNNRTLLVNANGAANCAARYSANPSARTQFVVGDGGLSLTGGTVRMCQTTAFLFSPGAGCGVAATNGTAPVTNSCTGVISNTGASIDWTAPNVNNTGDPTPEQLLQLEDLALWSESTGAWAMGGNSGDVKLAGIYFTPNADCRRP